MPKSNKKTLILINQFKGETILNEIVIGKILGDGSISKTGNLIFSQGGSQREYIEHCFTLFKPYLRPTSKIRIQIKKRKDKNHETLSFETCAIFKELVNLFYKNVNIRKTELENIYKRRKIVPDNIGELLSLRSLAYWIMDDGTYNKGKVYLCTYAFTFQENILLSTVLKTKFNIPCSVISRKNSNKKYNESTDIEGLDHLWYLIRIDNTKYLWDLVKEFILPFFYYKFGKYSKTYDIRRELTVPLKP